MTDRLIEVIDMPTGTIKFFNPARPPASSSLQGAGNVFVHMFAVERAGLRGLNEGQAVSYELEQDRGTGKASAVHLRLE